MPMVADLQLTDSQREFVAVGEVVRESARSRLTEWSMSFRHSSEAQVFVPTSRESLGATKNYAWRRPTGSAIA